MRIEEVKENFLSRSSALARARTAMPKASDDHAPALSAILVYTPIVLERGPAQRLDVSIPRARCS